MRPRRLPLPPCAPAARVLGCSYSHLVQPAPESASELAAKLAPFVVVRAGEVERFLDGLRAVPHELRRHEPVRHARHLAALWNVPLGEAGRATLFYADGASVLVLVPANRKISAPTLRTLLGVEELRVLRADRGVGRIGWLTLNGSPGALPAIPSLFGATLLVDQLALTPKRLVLSLDAGLSVAIAPQDYVTLANARVVNVAGRTRLPDRLGEGV